MASVLSNVDILRAMDSGEIAFDPPLKMDQFRLAGVELSLGKIAWKSRSEQRDVTLTEASPKLKVAPAEFLKFTIHERVKLSGALTGRVVGLPYFNELGIFVFPGSQVEPGFDGRLTVAAFNFSDKTILVKHKTPICLLEIARLETPADFSKGKKPFNIDIEEAIRVLETTPHERHELDEETLGWMKSFFDRIDSEEVIDTEFHDASENLDKYIYDPHYKDS